MCTEATPPEKESAWLSSTCRLWAETVLQRELGGLKKRIPFAGAENLKVCWSPKPGSQLSGEVVGNTVHIYDVGLNTAFSTLKHEYLDCMLTRRLIEPLTAIINALIELKAAEIYQEKERIIELMLKLLD